jgi:16S rRNA (cytosine967-C5)-methyltransferase
MKPSSLFGHLSEVYGIASEGSRPADLVIREYFRARRYLGSKERRFIAERFFGTVRHHVLLAARLAQAFRAAGVAVIPDPLPACALVAGHAILIALDPVESTIEAVAESCHTALPGLDVESILRFLPASDLPEEVRADAVEYIATLHSLPTEVVGEWVDRWGTVETALLAETLNHQAPLSLRVNPLRCSMERCREGLVAAGVETGPGVLAPMALTLRRRVTLDSLEPYRNGWFEMQDEGSQLLSLLLQPSPGMTVVDACAGGGGKTLHLAALMQNAGSLTAIDTDERKLEHLRMRVSRAGVSIVHTVSARSRQAEIHRLDGRADAVLVDAPCSGFGTLRRNPGLKLGFRSDISSRLAATQLALLDEYAALVKPGGRLVYSTCTLLRRENEEIAEDFLRRASGFTLLPAGEILQNQGITVDVDSPYLLLLPHRTTTDGFFAAVFTRRPVAGESEFV